MQEAPVTSKGPPRGPMRRRLSTITVVMENPRLQNQQDVTSVKSGDVRVDELLNKFPVPPSTIPPPPSAREAMNHMVGGVTSSASRGLSSLSSFWGGKKS
jgi:hypothetical protein